MLLHPAHLAQRRANPLLLSVTCDTLTTRKPYYRYEIAPGHYLIVIRDGVAYDELARAYTRHLPAWARVRIYTPLGVTDPAVDLAAHCRERWWDPTWPITPLGLAAMEEAAAEGGYVRAWSHQWLLDPPA